MVVFCCVVILIVLSEFLFLVLSLVVVVPVAVFSFVCLFQDTCRYSLKLSRTSRTIAECIFVVVAGRIFLLRAIVRLTI